MGNQLQKYAGSPEREVGRSRPVAGVGYIGSVPNAVWALLSQVWDEPAHISSDYARYHAILIAFAASMGWISNVSPSGLSYSRKWHITSEGIMALRARNEDH